MKKQFTSIMLVLLLCSACAGGQQSLKSESSQPEQAPGFAASELSIAGGITCGDIPLQFVEPELPYDILGVTPLNAGFAVVYQAEMPDEFNKIYSRDDVFYAVYTQVFDENGGYIETVDSQRRNSIKIVPPIHRLQADDDAVSFEVWSKNAAGKTEAVCFILAVNDNGKQSLGYNPNNHLYQQQEFYELAADGETQLQYTNVYNYAEGDEELLFRLVGPSGNVKELLVSFSDASFQNALYNMAHGTDDGDWLNDQNNPLYQLNLSVDAAAQTAELSNGKIHCRLNFSPKNRGCIVTRSYTDDMLGKLIATSPDKKKQIYSADVRNYFESVSGCDYVLRGESGELLFLFAGSDMDQLHFVDDERIWVNTFKELVFYDAKTGLPLDKQPGFDFGSQQNPYDRTVSGNARIALGTAVDSENKTLLVAHRPYTFGSGIMNVGTDKQTDQLPVMLTVLGWDGSQICTLDTGLTMRAFSKFFINIVRVNPKEGGLVELIVKDQSPVKINYIRRMQAA